MRKLALLLPVLWISSLLYGQAGQINQINIVNFNVKSVLPGAVDNWLSTPGALVLTAQKVPGAQVREPMMVLQVRSNGAIVCGNNMSTAKRIDPFDVRVFTTADLVGLLGNCHELKAGTYSICVQFFNIDKVAVSREVCKDFRVEETVVDYAPPTLITPDNGKRFPLSDLMKPLQFRWTPLVPKPKEPVTYRLKVWQLMQGQNGTAAMRSNTPIADKEVKEITQLTVTNLVTGPCRPPYLCDFIWNVQATNREGKPLGRNNGFSEAWTFSAEDAATVTPPINIFPDNNKQLPPDNAGNINFRWTPLVPKPSAPVTYRLKVWQLMQGQNGTTAMRSNQPIVTKDVDNITEANISGIYTGPCRPPYLCDFIWNVQVVTRDGTVGPSSDPTTFTIATAKSKGPDNLYPEDKKELTPEQGKNPITFRWTPIVPKPQEPVTYRLKVWQLMQGQNASQAMRSNQPIVTKDVDNITEAVVNGVITGPCRPPYLCDFIWNVEATVRQAGAAPKVIGSSNPTAFSIAPTYIIQLDSIKVLCTSTPGVYSFSYTISNVNAGTANLTNLAITSSVPAGATLGAFAPPIGTAIATGNQLTITGTINAAPNLSNICIGAEITDAANSFWKASRDTCIPVVPCKCDVCDSVKIDVNPKGEITLDTAGSIIQNNTISVSPKPVKNIKAELVYFEYKPDSDDCMICNKDSRTYGNFINASSGLVSPTIPYPHTVNWTPNGQMVTNQALNFVISMPPTVKCCAATVKWCIRYVVTFMDCTVCSVVKCYTYNKKCECK
ncbi:MAG: hypothetical protein NTW29_01350 [Bacteroidetes bacterium]|nr:hypothetical protein [Bacteroidota bacterium]